MFYELKLKKHRIIEGNGTFSCISKQQGNTYSLNLESKENIIYGNTLIEETT